MGHSLRQASLLATAIFATGAGAAIASEEVNIYTNRPSELIRPLLDAFTGKTGIAANLLFIDQGLIERIRAEGDYSPADVILTLEDSRLDDVKAAGITEPLDDATLKSAIPANYRDKDGNWFGLTMRPRVVYANREQVPQDAITYEDLSLPAWKGKVCVRDGRHPTNIALFASMIALHGETYTEKWLGALKGNLARKPRGNDRSQAEAVAAGTCAVALGNAEYAAALAGDNEGKQEAAKIKVIFPNAADRGTSVTISGMALARKAPNRENAVKLMEFLASKPAQELYSRETNEYPVTAGAQPSAALRTFGTLKPEDLSMAEITRLREQALDIVERIRFNDGPTN